MLPDKTGNQNSWLAEQQLGHFMTLRFFAVHFRALQPTDWSGLILTGQHVCGLLVPKQVSPQGPPCFCGMAAKAGRNRLFIILQRRGHFNLSF